MCLTSWRRSDKELNVTPGELNRVLMKYAALEVIGRHQRMLATRRQILDVYSKAELETMVRNGVIHRITPAVYRLLGSDLNYEQRVLAALLDAGSGVASHRSAAKLWGILNTNRAEITVPSGSYSKNALAKLHRSRDMNRTYTLRDIPLTNPARTLIDIARPLKKSVLTGAFERTLRDGLATFASLRNEIELYRAPGRPGIAPIERLIKTYDSRNPRCVSGFQIRALKALRTSGLPEPEREYPVVVEDVPRWLDFAYPEFFIGIEVDSRGYHTRLQDFEKDRTRYSGFNALGWRMLSITEATFEEDIARVVCVFDRCVKGHAA